MIRKIVAIVLLAAFGGLKMPVEVRLDKAQKKEGLRQPPLNLDLRERVGQMGFLAALSGFRSPLAAILWIDAYNAWERTEWGRMVGLFDTVTTLQPRSTLYWDMASWHMAYNAAVAALEDKNQPSEALRIRNQRQYIKLGRTILENGIRNNPDSWFLYRQLGILLSSKEEDHCGAAEAYLKASQLPGCPEFVARLAGYEMAECPGHEKKAYEYLKKLYDKSPDERKPTLVGTIVELEKKLDIPPAQRIPSQPEKP